MTRFEWIMFQIMEFIERNQMMAVFIIAMGVVAFALYVVLRATQRA